MSKVSSWKTIFFLCVFCAVEAIGLPAQTFNTLLNFDGANGSEPTDQLIQGIDGNLYGTTFQGGANGRGTLFQITTGGTLTTLYSFCSQPACADGYEPSAGLVQATNGNFYGTTTYGGVSSNCPYGAAGCGTIFEITPGGTLTTLYTFCSQTGCTDGGGPYAGLARGTDGNFYGTTYFFGSNVCSNGCGTVFKITPEGTLTTLHSFDGTDGSSPYGGLIQANDGNFYGTTDGGGANGTGSVFKITPGGTLTTLHSFDVYGTDGSGSRGTLVQAIDGNFYGTTLQGGANGFGDVFKITPGGALTVLHSFDFTTDGGYPYDGLVQATDGNFYGTTLQGGSGGCEAGCGTVFQITPGGTLTTFPTFDGTYGGYPEAGLLQATNGSLYGTTEGGGAGPDGAIFSLSVGLGPFVETLPTSGGVGAAVIVLGNNLTGATVVSFNGTAATFTVVSDTEIETTVPAGATTGTVQVTTTNATLHSNVPFQVTAQQALPIANVAPTGLTFGSETVGRTTASQPVTLSNTGNAPLTITSIAASTNFGETNNCGGSVAASSSCTINVTFSPTTTGTLAGTLTITDNSNGVAGSTQTVSLSGTGTAPVAGVSPFSLTFTSQSVGTTSASQPVTLSNTGAAALTIASIAASTNFGETNNCGGSVAASSSCTINVTFSPTAIGTLTGALTITDNSNGVAGSMQTVALTGTAATPAASLSAASFSFGGQVINTASAAKKVTLTSTGTANLSISNFTITGTNAGDFAETNNCPASMPPASKCTISLIYTPAVLGAETASLAVSDNAANSPQTVALSGSGESPVVLSPTSLSFGNVGEKSPSASKSITLTNHQAVALTITSIALSNPDYTETNTCNGSVTAKGTCAISVTLTPSALGADDATLSVNDSASNTPQMATLTGTGIVPAKLSATSLGFGNVPQSTPSASRDITLTNHEDVPLTISGIATGNLDFTERDTCDGSIPAKGNCVMTVTFTPSIIGAETGTLSVSDAASDSPQVASLTGTGIVQTKISPDSLAFAAQKVGTTSAAKNVTLTNNLSTALTMSSITFTGADPGDFAAPTNTCGGGLAAKSTCTISITFTPGATGTRTATMNVNDNANNTPQTVALTGMGK